MSVFRDRLSALKKRYAARLPRRAAVSFTSLWMLVALAACQMFPALGPTSVVESTATSLATQPAPKITSTSLQTPSPDEPSPGPVTLRLWLPAQFDPSSGTPAGDILSARLSEFAAQNTGLRIEVRLKALDGAGGLLEALTAANAAAPLALPDLIALPRPLLESAALKGLLYSYDGLSDLMKDDGWYDYARQLAYLQENVFGLPFAGDAQSLAYRPAAVEIPPQDWESALAFGIPLAFSAADPRALFTITQYQALGGALRDEQGRPMLDEAVLTQVLALYQRAGQAGMMPVWLTQLEKDEQVWQAFTDEQASMAVVWASTYLGQSADLPFETMITPQVTAAGSSYTLATGWVWALASPNPARRQLAASLAEYLVGPQFLSDWDAAIGYLPPRLDSLNQWGDEATRPVVSKISLTAQLIPSDDLLASLGPAIEEAVVLVLKQQADPETAAKIAAERVNQP